MSSDHEERLRNTFEAVRGAAPAVVPDWEDVRRRAARANATHTRVGRPRLRLLGVAAAVAAVLVVPPMSVGARLVALVRPDPAPAVRSEIADMNRHFPLGKHDAVVRKTHRVATISQYGRSVSLWVAPTRSGGACSLVRTARSSAGGCLTAARFGVLEVSLLGVGGPATPPANTGTLGPGALMSPSAAILSGHVPNAVRRVELRYADGARSVLPLHQGWFLFAVPLAHLRTGHRPVSISALDEHGSVRFSETKLFQHVSRYEIEKPLKREIRTLTTLPVDVGTRATLQTAKSPEGGECISVLVNGKALDARWRCGPNVGHRVTREYGAAGIVKNSLLHWDPSAGGLPPHALPIASGWAAAPITKLRVRYRDGSTTPLALHDRLYVYVVPPAHRSGSATPVRLEGLDSSSKVIQSLRIDKQRCARGTEWRCAFP